MGVITGPGGLEIAYSVLPVPDFGPTPDDGHLSSEPERLKQGKHL
ncbi:MAG: hypothetical protein ABI614_04945 [Planctomycetota bacterium]